MFAKKEKEKNKHRFRISHKVSTVGAFKGSKHSAKARIFLVNPPPTWQLLCASSAPSSSFFSPISAKNESLLKPLPSPPVVVLAPSLFSHLFPSKKKWKKVKICRFRLFLLFRFRFGANTEKRKTRKWKIPDDDSAVLSLFCYVCFQSGAFVTAAPEEEKRQGGEVRTSPFDVFQGGRERKKRGRGRSGGKKEKKICILPYREGKASKQFTIYFTMASAWFFTSIIY